ncbi:hypothetical protein OBBRIDRAFT_229033 [Obba rivulosa]|uniref:Uncharacterized protein n=1 Tax=Obba rivulosa TaxID=1052685 RepID=A0A8E2DUT2_9APHY|nr:hypothetical protein OBBRIDRAFT_229033 [Obba rivulosa]
MFLHHAFPSPPETRALPALSSLPPLGPDLFDISPPIPTMTSVDVYTFAKPPFGQQLVPNDIRSFYARHTVPTPSALSGSRYLRTRPLRATGPRPLGLNITDSCNAETSGPIAIASINQSHRIFTLRRVEDEQTLQLMASSKSTPILLQTTGNPHPTPPLLLPSSSARPTDADSQFQVLGPSSHDDPAEGSATNRKTTLQARRVTRGDLKLPPSISVPAYTAHSVLEESDRNTSELRPPDTPTSPFPYDEFRETLEQLEMLAAELRTLDPALVPPELHPPSPAPARLSEVQIHLPYLVASSSSSQSFGTRVARRGIDVQVSVVGTSVADASSLPFEGDLAGGGRGSDLSEVVRWVEEYGDWGISDKGKWKTPEISSSEVMHVQPDAHMHDRHSPSPSITSSTPSEPIHAYEPGSAPEFLVGSSTSLQVRGASGYISKPPPRPRRPSAAARKRSPPVLPPHGGNDFMWLAETFAEARAAAPKSRPHTASSSPTLRKLRNQFSLADIPGRTRPSTADVPATARSAQQTASSSSFPSIPKMRRQMSSADVMGRVKLSESLFTLGMTESASAADFKRKQTTRRGNTADASASYAASWPSTNPLPLDRSPDITTPRSERKGPLSSLKHLFKRTTR